MRGRIYFIGSGPGDPALMTIRGMELLRSASMVLVPGFFKDTYAEYLKGKDWFDPFDYYHADLVARVDACLDGGRDAAFLIPGDLAIFSPVQSLIDYFKDSAVVVPGVSSLNAASAALRRTFDLPGISHSTIATSPKTITGTKDTIAELSKHQSTMVLFMNNKQPAELSAELLEGYDAATPVAVVYNISLPSQEVHMTTVGSLAADVDGRFADEDSFKLVIVGRALTAAEDPSWWNRRKDSRDARHAAKKQRDAKA